MPKITIQGIEFEVSDKYKEGDVLSAAEAATLNQTRAENLRNNFANRVREAKDAAGAEAIPDETLEKLYSDFEAYAGEYEFHGKRTARGPADPVLRIAQQMAKALINERLRANKMEKPSDEKMAEMVTTLIEKRKGLGDGLDIWAEAERRVAAQKAAASASLDDLLEGLPPKAAEPAGEPAAA